MYQLDRRSIAVRDGKRSERWFYLAFEGDNEATYFGIIKDSKSKIGIDDSVDCIRLYRFKEDKDSTDPRWIMDRMQDFRKSLLGDFTPKLFLQQVLMEFRKRVLNDASPSLMNKEYDHFVYNLDSGIAGIEQELVDKIEEELCSKGIITDTSEALSIVRRYLKNAFPRFKRAAILLTNPDKHDLDEKDIAGDRFCVIVDRDHHSDAYRLREGETESNYFERLMSCFEGSRISIYVTNPAFEFWLLLHLDDIRFDEKKMLENPKDDSDRRYSERVLSEYIPGYNKHSLDRTVFIGKDGDCKPILKALDVAEEIGYARPSYELESRIGSSIPLLINEMRSADEGHKDRLGKSRQNISFHV